MSSVVWWVELCCEVRSSGDKQIGLGRPVTARAGELRLQDMLFRNQDGAIVPASLVGYKAVSASSSTMPLIAVTRPASGRGETERELPPDMPIRRPRPIPFGIPRLGHSSGHRNAQRSRASIPATPKGPGRGRYATQCQCRRQTKICCRVGCSLSGAGRGERLGGSHDLCADVVRRIVSKYPGGSVDLQR